MYDLFKGRKRFARYIMLWKDGSRAMFDELVRGLHITKLSSLQNRDGNGE